jgi:hypothetical protein
VRIIPPGPGVPRIQSVTDGINILSGTRIVTGSVKVFIADAAHPEKFLATVDGAAVGDIDTFCTDPITRSYEFNFKLPDHIASGPHEVGIAIGRRTLGRIAIEVAR